MARRLDAAVRQAMHTADVPGATVGIWAPGQSSYIRSFGVADRSTGRRMTPNLFMRIGSETKTFTVSAPLQLVDRKKVGPDDPIGAYVDGVPGGDQITLRQLAGMRSGLHDCSEDRDFVRAPTSNPQRSFTPRQLLGHSFKHRVLFGPGQEFSSSNTNLILLGLVVAEASGQHLGDYVKQHVTDPAGMKDTVFPTGNELPRPHARGYTEQTANGKVADATHWNPSWGWAAGAMISKLEDLRVRAPTAATGEFPDGKRMISAATRKQRLITPQTDTIKGAGYGLGIFDVRGWIGHNGSLPGYESLTVHLPSTGTTLVVLRNTDAAYQGQEASTLVGRAITSILTPAHAYNPPRTPTG